MSIATLSHDEQAKLMEHGHFDSMQLVRYGTPDSGPSILDSLVVECVLCGEVLVELIGGREQDDQ